jgi:hypothetical protein
VLERRAAKLCGGLDLDVGDGGAVGKVDVCRNQRDVGPPARGFLSERESHAPAGAVTEEAHRVHGLTRAAGGDQYPRSVERTRRSAARHELHRGKQVLRLGEAADTPLAPGGQGAGAGLDHAHPAFSQGVDVRLGGGVLVHVVVHRRSDRHRALAGQVCAGEQVVGEARGELCDRVRGRRCYQVHVAAPHQLEVDGRIVIGRLLARVGAASGVPLELVDENGRPGDRLEGGASHKFQAGGRLDDAHRVPGSRRKTGELNCLVGGYSTADSEQDPCHP